MVNGDNDLGGERVDIYRKQRGNSSMRSTKSTYPRVKDRLIYNGVLTVATFQTELYCIYRIVSSSYVKSANFVAYV